MKGILVIIGIGTLALLAMGGVAAGYFLLADVWPVTNINDLTSFGTFFGGVAGPILGLLTFFGVIFTLALQGAQLRQLQPCRAGETRAVTPLAGPAHNLTPPVVFVFCGMNESTTAWRRTAFGGLQPAPHRIEPRANRRAGESRTVMPYQYTLQSV